MIDGKYPQQLAECWTFLKRRVRSGK